MKPANFNRIARPYRWLEYITLGLALARCRTHFLGTCLGAPSQSAPSIEMGLQHALILGDGDGRFTAALLAAHPALHADAVDSSATMLHLLRQRCGPTTLLRTHHTNALTFTPSPTTDLIVAHFFFDCLTQPELHALIPRIVSSVQPHALWLVSDFRIPPGALHWPARLYVRTLYLAFRVLTGLRVTRLPDHTAALRAAGLEPIAIHRSLFGLLTTELWQLGRLHPFASTGTPAVAKKREPVVEQRARPDTKGPSS